MCACVPGLFGVVAVKFALTETKSFAIAARRDHGVRRAAGSCPIGVGCDVIDSACDLDDADAAFDATFGEAYGR